MASPDHLSSNIFIEIYHVPSPELGIAGKKEAGAGPVSEGPQWDFSPKPSPPLPSLYKPWLRGGILCNTASGVTPVTWMALVLSNNKSVRLSYQIFREDSPVLTSVITFFFCDEALPGLLKARSVLIKLKHSGLPRFRVGTGDVVLAY